MLLRVDATTTSEKEEGTGGMGDCRLDPGDGLGDGAEFKSADAGGGEERSEDHVITWRDADHIIDAGVDPLHEAAARPSGSKNHDPRLVGGLSRVETRRERRGGRAEMGGEREGWCKGFSDGVGGSSGGGEENGKGSSPRHFWFLM